MGAQRWSGGRILACHAGDPGSTTTLPSTYSVFGTRPGSAAAPPRGRRATSALPNGGRGDRAECIGGWVKIEGASLLSAAQRGTPDG